tara:strand:- start:2940 stop:3533 length:594 start_codon:yes stop_codon:yes gene_type:complete
MTDYTVTATWNTKNALADSEALKVVDADEFHTEFTNLATHSATKANKASNLSDLASASTARTNLGLAIGTNVQAYDANNALTDVAQTFTAQQRPLTDDLTYNATQTWDCNAAQDARLTLTANVTTFSAPTNQVAGSYYTLRLNLGSTPFTVSAWNAVFKWPAGTAPTLSTGANAIDVFVFRSDGTNMENIGQSQAVA